MEALKYINDYFSNQLDFGNKMILLPKSNFTQ